MVRDERLCVSKLRGEGSNGPAQREMDPLICASLLVCGVCSFGICVAGGNAAAALPSSSNKAGGEPNAPARQAGRIAKGGMTGNLALIEALK